MLGCWCNLGSCRWRRLLRKQCNLGRKFLHGAKIFANMNKAMGLLHQLTFGGCVVTSLYLPLPKALFQTKWNHHQQAQTDGLGWLLPQRRCLDFVAGRLYLLWIYMAMEWSWTDRSLGRLGCLPDRPDRATDFQDFHNIWAPTDSSSVVQEQDYRFTLHRCVMFGSSCIRCRLLHPSFLRLHKRWFGHQGCGAPFAIHRKPLILISNK